MENSNFEILTVLFFKNKIFSKFLVCSSIWFFVCFIDRRLKYKPLYIKSIIMLTNVTSVLGITHSTSARHRRNMGLLLEPNRVIAKDVKSCTYCCYFRCATLIVWIGVMPWPKNRRNSIPCTVRTSRQRSCNQRVGCLQ